jgi:uncharacterized protein (TIGR02300 family)
LAKPELGTKRICPSCGTKYYDLKRDPIICPTCGTIFAIAAPVKAAVVAAVVKPAPVEELDNDAVAETEADVVSLEEVEADAEPDVGPEVEEDETAIPEVEVEAEIEPGEDTFLEEEPEEGDVSGLLDVDDENEEEV